MKKYSLEIVESSCGTSVYLNEYRIAGPKPLGGGCTIKKMLCKPDDITNAIASTVQENKAPTDEQKKAAWKAAVHKHTQSLVISGWDPQTLYMIQCEYEQQLKNQ